MKDHHNELVENDRRAKEFHIRGMDAQHRRGGIVAASDDNLTTEERVTRLTERMRQKL